MDFGLSDVHVLVTGASGGIGAETAKLFTDLGSLVTAHYNSKRPPAPNSSSSESAAAGAPAANKTFTVQADVRSEDAVERMFEDAEAHFGGKAVQVLVVNHGISGMDYVPLHEMTTEQWERTLSVNLTGVFFVIRAFLRRIEVAKQDGKWTDDELDKVAIVLVGSTAGKFGEAGNADYSSSKAAMMYGLLPSLKNEIVSVAPKGRVNCVAPSWVLTPMAAKVVEDPEVFSRAIATRPLKSLATPRDVANQIAVLASSSLSGHVTGEKVFVSGGMEGRLLCPPDTLAPPGKGAAAAESYSNLYL